VVSSSQPVEACRHIPYCFIRLIHGPSSYASPLLSFTTILLNYRGQYADNEQKFKVNLCGAPCSEPGCWMGSMICMPCAQYKLRHMALNHIEPGSGWNNYSCCQGMFGGCCCIQPGKMGEESCPQACYYFYFFSLSLLLINAVLLSLDSFRFILRMVLSPPFPFA